ncbi:hypothetical protein WJX79_002197 [Trebouxia sp. C0005]
MVRRGIPLHIWTESSVLVSRITLLVSRNCSCCSTVREDMALLFGVACTENMRLSTERAKVCMEPTQQICLEAEGLCC